MIDYRSDPRSDRAVTVLDDTIARRQATRPPTSGSSPLVAFGLSGRGGFGSDFAGEGQVLHTQLLKVINTKEAWAFVGSGPSIDAGLPGWKALVEHVVASDADAHPLLKNEAFSQAFAGENYPRCFGMIEAAIGRARLDDAVSKSIPSTAQPGDMHRLLADLPFKGYITTNYDNLLETALGGSGLTPGWVSIGNQSDEHRKISRDVTGVVWHVHGALGLPSGLSRLVLTQQDYDELYDNSPTLQQLRSLISQRNVVVVGFGFADIEVTRLIRLLGRMTDATRPIFAMLPKKGDFANTVSRKVFLHETNVDVIPYKIRQGGHRALADLLRVYSALSLRRSIRFGQDRRDVPAYDPETTGLLIYNELVLSRGNAVSTEVRQDLLKSRLLTLLLSNGPLDKADVVGELQELSARIGHRVVGARPGDTAEADLDDAVRELEAKGLVVGNGAQLELTDQGENSLAAHSAAARLLEDQFRASLRERAQAFGSGRTVDVLSKSLEAFLKDCIEKRSLGVAMAMTLHQPAQQEYHMVALLQGLGDVLSELEDEEEARSLIELVQAVFRGPNDIERKFIGVALQARFGVHLLGFDDATLVARARDVSETAFLIDSSTLIPFLARSGRGHTASTRLIQSLSECGSQTLTTRMLVEEVAEHAQWALDLVREGHSIESLPVFEAATGRAGQRSNAFLGGYIVELANGTAPATFQRYVEETCGMAAGAVRVQPADVERHLRELGVACLNVGNAFSSDDDIRVLQEYQSRLQWMREQKETFTRSRQVAAEAQALMTIERIRANQASAIGVDTRNAYFITNTQIIDQVAHSDIAVTMRPEAALQWLATLRPGSSDDLAALTSGLLWELQERGFDIVDKAPR